MDNQADGSLVFSSKTRVFRVLSVDGDSIGPHPRAGRGRPKETGTALWLSPSLEDAIDEWAAAQPDPKPGRMEAVQRLLGKALAPGS